MPLIQTWGNQLKNVHEGVWLNCPHPLLMVCLCLIALQIPHCERSGWFSDYWSVPGISWSCSARAALLLWPGWGPTSARLSSAPALKCQSWCCRWPVCLTPVEKTDTVEERRWNEGWSAFLGLSMPSSAAGTSEEVPLTCLGWMQLQLKRGSTSPALSILFVWVPCPPFSRFSFPGKLPDIFFSDCEITVTMLCT